MCNVLVALRYVGQWHGQITNVTACSFRHFSPLIRNRLLVFNYNYVAVCVRIGVLCMCVYVWECYLHLLFGIGDNNVRYLAEHVGNV